MATVMNNSSSTLSSAGSTGNGMRTSPPLPPYISPGLTPSPSQWQSTGTFRPPPPFTLSETVGTQGTDKRITRPNDIAKFKTEMCRNWELTGACSYRQCNFAHGADELRKPATAAPHPVAPPTISAVERIMEAISVEVHNERDSQFQLQECNRNLEQQLRKTQQDRFEEAKQLEAMEAEIAALRSAIRQRDEQLEARSTDDVQKLLANLRTEKV